MHWLGRIMIFAELMVAISNRGISSENTLPPVTVKLADGSRSSEGRVEVYLDGRWGTVCNNLWTLREANVVCRQLGYVGADRVFYSGERFGQGVGDILLDMVQCDGSEVDLLDCPRGVNTGPECDHSEDVGVECTIVNSIRLSGGPSYRRGRLEMLDDVKQWGTVCAQDWDRDNTIVACRQLGLGEFYDGNREWFTADPGSGPIVTGGLNCTGYEDRLENCTQAVGWTPDNCDPNGHSQDIGVQCYSDIHLEYGGFVVVSHGGVKGAICVDNWDENAASVACRHQGYKGVKETTTAYNYYPNHVDIILRNLVCSGDESFYTECESAEWAYEGDCDKEYVAAVICEVQEPEISISRISPNYRGIGKVEITFTEPMEYVSVCYRVWTIEDAHVVCQQEYNTEAVQVFPTESWPYDENVITEMDCPDDATSLANCTFETMDLDDAEDCGMVGGVVCYEPAEDSLVPLVSGGSSSEGVLEYKISGLPSHICDPDWSSSEATVACRTYGYDTGNAVQVVELGHTRDSFPVGFQNYNITCTGSESSLAECQMESIDDIGECHPNDIAQVRCQPNKDYDLRMVGSTASEQGRVEVFLGGEWGTVSFSDPDELDFSRRYICQNLGYEEDVYHAFEVAGVDSPFGEGTGKVLKCQFPDPELCDDELSEVAEGELRNETNVVCLPYETVEYHPVRLVSETGVANSKTGRVEILHDGKWGAVCESEYSDTSLDREVCSELGYTDLTFARYLTGEDREPFLTGDEKIWLQISYCSPSSTRLYKCKHGPWGYFSDHCFPAVVTCVPDPTTADPGNAPSLLHYRKTGLIPGLALLVLVVAM